MQFANTNYIIGYSGLDANKKLSLNYDNNEFHGLFVMKGNKLKKDKEYMVIIPNEKSDFDTNNKFLQKGIEIDNILYKYDNFSIVCKWENNKLNCLLINDNTYKILWTLPNDVLEFLEFNRYTEGHGMFFDNDKLMIKKYILPNSYNPIPYDCWIKPIILNNHNKLGKVDIIIIGENDNERLDKSYFTLDNQNYYIKKCTFFKRDDKIALMSNWLVDGFEKENVILTLGYVDYN